MLFQPEEKVLCFHGPLMYQAKACRALTQILQAEEWTGKDNEGGASGPHYFVHYLGWKKTWDEWVPQERVLKLCDENLAKQKALVDAQRAESEAAPRDDSSARRDAKKVGRGSKRSREASEHDEEKRPELRLAVPESLKAQLVDDWENVTRKEQLVPLPRTPTVKDILAEFGGQYAKRGRTRPAVLDEVLAGLKLYFDRSLAQNLLYRFERQQYVDLRREHAPKGEPGAATPDIEPSAFYGAEHLLRLFGTLCTVVGAVVGAAIGDGCADDDDAHPANTVNLPSIVAHTSMDARSIALIREYTTELLAYLAREQSRLFVSTYMDPSPAYHRAGVV
ncbi:Esa1p-associated factor [Malassezia cuniculi]|uniref:Chromatin modification-related protein EAF3 n=1 Tax=Malassezia cuniculi TaxID=948313 RepID=A0AAF0F1N8_9BASI|nr:Esa1p-associated factor [Malassezia cuniculi]